MARTGWYERDEIGKVTRDWVDMNCVNVTDRELELLEIVSDRKLVRRDHLEVIHPEYRHLSEVSRVKVMNRSISKLFKLMCLDKVHEKAKVGTGNLPCVVAVDKAGSVLLEKAHKKRIQHEKKNIKGQDFIFRQLPPNWKHIHMVNGLEVETINFIEKYKEEGYEMRWRLENENYYRFFTNQKEQLIIPDVLLGLKMNKRVLWCWMEVDTGSENHRNATAFPVLHEKLNRYRQFKISGLWEKEFKKFPPILFVTSDEKRVKYVQKTMTQMQLAGEVVLKDDYPAFLENLK